MTEVKLGTGSVLMWNIGKDGQQGILFQSMDKPAKIGSTPPEYSDVNNLKITPRDDDVFILCSKLESAQVLQEIVNIMVLHLSGRKVVNESR